MIYIYIIALIIALGIWAFLYFNKGNVIVVISPKARRMEKAKRYLKVRKEITNNQYQKLTGVSDAQAVRDLDELEKQNIVKQIGKTGKYTKYQSKI